MDEGIEFEKNRRHCRTRSILKQKMGILIDDDEVGYIALYIHSAIGDEKDEAKGENSNEKL